MMTPSTTQSSRFAWALAALLALPACGQADETAKPGIQVPEGFEASVFADELGRGRFLAVAPSGDVYMKTTDAGIIALRDTDGDGQADVHAVIGDVGGTGIAIRGGWLYHSSTTTVYRYRLEPGALAPSGHPQVIVSGLPDEREHGARSIAFDGDGRLYVEVGAPSNASGDPDRTAGAKGKDPSELQRTKGGFWRFDAERQGQTQADGFHFSTGHRHILAVDWNPVSQALFVVQNGRDQLSTVDPDHYSSEDNAELPAEELHVLREGAHLGWPYTYWDPIRKARMLAPEWGGNNAKRAEEGEYPDPLVAFPAHWAPMQMAFYEGDVFPQKYRNGAFVAFHGSWNRAPHPQKGYRVVFVPFGPDGMPTGAYETFADGFAGTGEIDSPRDARYRPNGVAAAPDGSLFVADSQKGRIWRITYTGAAGIDTARADDTAGVAAEATGGQGAALYATHCGICHMNDGGGVPNMQPALTGGITAAADVSGLIRAALRGSEGLADGRDAYTNVMPPFDWLDDAQLAAIVSYVRKRFGDRNEAITPEQIAAQR